MRRDHASHSSGGDGRGPAVTGAQDAIMVVEDEFFDARVARLSPREVQVVLLTAEGASVQDLSTDLGIGIGTIMSIRRHIRNKLGLSREISLEEVLPYVVARFCGIPLTAEEDRQAQIGPDVPDLRRRHLMLRQAIAELERLGQKIEGRGAAVARMVEAELDPRPDLEWQLGHLRRLAQEIASLVEGFVANLRGTAPDA